MILSCCCYTFLSFIAISFPLRIFFQYPMIVHTSLFLFYFKWKICPSSPKIALTQREKHERLNWRLLGYGSILDAERRVLEGNLIVIIYEKRAKCGVCCRNCTDGKRWCYESPGVSARHAHTQACEWQWWRPRCHKFAVIREDMNNVAYPYTWKSNEEVSDTLGDMFTSRYDAWDSRAMLPKPSYTPNPSLVSNIRAISKESHAVSPCSTLIISPIHPVRAGDIRASKLKL